MAVDKQCGKKKKRNYVKSTHLAQRYNTMLADFKKFIMRSIRGTQCGNLAIFLPLQFYVKAILADFRRSKIAILTLLKFEF